MNLKEKILAATLQVFKEKGIKFTMDDLAKQLSISKKTIYGVFTSKEALIDEMVDDSFVRIKESEAKIATDAHLSTLEKLEKILAVLPDGYKDLDLSQLYVLKNKYPKTYQKVEEHLESGWEMTIDLMNKGIEEGVLKPISIPIFKLMFESTLESFFQRDVLIRQHMSYSDALHETVDILINGIKESNDD